MIPLLFILITTILTPQGAGILEVNGTVKDVEGPFLFNVSEANNTSLIIIKPIEGITYRNREGILISVERDGRVEMVPAIVVIAYSNITGEVDVGNITVKQPSFVVSVGGEEEGIDVGGLALGLGVGLVAVYLLSKKLREY